MIKSGKVEYNMPKAQAEALLKERKGEERKLKPEQYLIKVINESYGLLRNCIAVKVY